MSAPDPEKPPADLRGFEYRLHEAPRHHTRVKFTRQLLTKRMAELVALDDVKPGQKVLDYGCGERPYESILRTKFQEYIGADIPGNPKAEVTVGPKGELPLADQSVDCVISTQVLEHVQEPQVYLGEAKRVLKPGGVLILSTHGHWRYHAHPNDFWRWTVQGLQMEIRKAGFEILQVRGVLRLSSAALQMWQDATSGPLPRILRSIYIRILQLMIRVIERRKMDPEQRDAAIYVVLAKKP
jgi:ubiquinone/menaquinone biosynthesis C-methylase UbiE